MSEETQGLAGPQLEYNKDADGVEHVVVDHVYFGTRADYEQHLKDGGNPDGTKKETETETKDEEKQTAEQSDAAGQESDSSGDSAKDGDPSQAQGDETSAKKKRPGSWERKWIRSEQMRQAAEQRSEEIALRMQEIENKYNQLQQQQQSGLQSRQDSMRQYMERLSGQLQRGETPTDPNGRQITPEQAASFLAGLYQELSGAAGVGGFSQQPQQQQQQPAQAFPPQPELSPDEASQELLLRGQIQNQISSLPEGDPSIVNNIPADLVAPFSTAYSPADLTLTINGMANSDDPELRKQVNDILIQMRYDEQGRPRSLIERMQAVKIVEQNFIEEHERMLLEQQRQREKSAKEPQRGADGRFVSKKSSAQPAGHPEQAGAPAGKANAYAGPEMGEDESPEEYQSRRDREIHQEMMDEAKYREARPSR